LENSSWAQFFSQNPQEGTDSVGSWLKESPNMSKHLNCSASEKLPNRQSASPKVYKKGLKKLPALARNTTRLLFCWCCCSWSEEIPTRKLIPMIST
jgi:hypothetical protein